MQDQDDSSAQRSDQFSGNYESTQDARSLSDPIQRIDPGAGDQQRYEMIRHHARGGLGKVSVAVDQKFGRTVAFKEMRDSSSIGSATRELFLREAEITATLEHPGIVPIYDAGYREDGSPFYAMRFIEGQSLKKAIKGFHAQHQKANRSEWHQELQAMVSRLIEVCNAIEYAHSRGVLHRDIKPANVMLGPFGETLVVDWGLAKRFEEKQSDSDPDSEFIVGTTGFMSPEQSVSADRVGVTSDVYSLGATLYTILTGKVSVQIDTLAELQVALERGMYPPPRKLEKRTPGPLDAICQKAMAARPEERYQSVAHFSRALRRWLSNQSIEAYREPIHERCVRWVSRNRTFAAGVMVLLCAAVVGFAINARIANTQKEKSEAGLTQLMTTTERFFDDTQQYLKGVPALTSLRIELLEESHRLHEKMLAENPDHPRVIFRTSKVCAALAELYVVLNRKDDARKLYKQSLNLCESILNSDQPLILGNGLTPQAWFCAVRCQYGGFLVETDPPQQVREMMQSLLDEFQTEKGLSPDDRTLFIASAQLVMARALDRQGKVDEAIELLRLARSEFMVNPGSTVAQLNIGQQLLADMLQQTGRLNDADAAWTDAIGFAENALNEPGKIKERDRRDYKEWLAGSIKNRAQLWAALGRVPEAIPEFQKSLDIFEEIAGQFPGISDYALKAIMSRIGLAICLCRCGKMEESLPEYEQAISEIRILVNRYPDEPGYQRVLGTSLKNFATAKYQLQRFDEALKLSEKIVAHQKDLAARFTDPAYKFDLAASQISYAASLTRTNADVNQTFAVYQQAIDTLERLIQDLPGPTAFQSKLALAYMNKADLLSKHCRSEASDYFKKSESIYLALLEGSPENQELFLKLAMIRDNRGRIALQQQNWQMAEAAFTPAINYFDEAWQQGQRQQGMSLKRMKVRRLLAEALIGQNKVSQALNTIQKAINIAEVIHEEEPDRHHDQIAELLLMQCDAILAQEEPDSNGLANVSESLSGLENCCQKMEGSDAAYYSLCRRLMQARLLAEQQKIDESQQVVASVVDDIDLHIQQADSPLQDYDLTGLKVESLQLTLENSAHSSLTKNQPLIAQLEATITRYASEESVPIDAVSTQDARLKFMSVLLNKNQSEVAINQFSEFSDFVTDNQLEQLSQLFLSPIDDSPSSVQTVSASNQVYHPVVVSTFQRILEGNPTAAAFLKKHASLAKALAKPPE